MWYVSSLLNNDVIKEWIHSLCLIATEKKNNSNDEIDKYLHKTENRSYLDK
jgi:hypothetical protein